MACSSPDREQTDPVKQQVAAHWDRRAAHFDEDFGHSIRTAAERAAWDRILDLTLPAGDALEALDIGCGTGSMLAPRRKHSTTLAGAPNTPRSATGSPLSAAGHARRSKSSSRHISSSTSPATRSPISSPRKSGAWRRKGSNGVSAGATPSGATCRAKA
jgi:hypothetical protein